MLPVWYRAMIDSNEQLAGSPKYGGLRRLSGTANGRNVNARILAVDDVSHNLELMTYLLQASGHEVIGAATGIDALRLAAQHHPDLVVLDVQLPDIDGYEVLRRLRAAPATWRVPVIAVTAYAMVGDRDDALAAGFDGYLAKPIDPMTLADALDAFLPPARRRHVPGSTTRTTMSLPSPAHEDEEGRTWQPS